MKRLLFLSLLALPMFGQATFPIQIPGESAVSVTLSAQAVSSVTLFIQSNTVGISPTTVASPVLSTDTSIALASGTGITTGMGLLIGSEISIVTAVSGNTMTVTRARVGTAAAAHSTADVVTILRSGSYSEFISNLLVDAVKISMTATPASTITAQNAAIASAQATIQTTVNAAVSHVP